MLGKLAMMQKFVTYVERISEDEMYVERIGDEGKDCNLCGIYIQDRIGGILY
jgi:hypothetical protein